MALLTGWRQGECRADNDGSTGGWGLGNLPLAACGIEEGLRVGQFLLRLRQFKLFLCLLLEAQDFRLHIAFGPEIVPLPPHDTHPLLHMRASPSSSGIKFPVKVTQAACDIVRIPALHVIGAPQMRQMCGAESRFGCGWPEVGNEFGVGAPD